MKLEPGIYHATKDTEWSFGDQSHLPIFRITSVKNFRVFYQYIYPITEPDGDGPHTFSRGIDSFLDCNPLPATDLIKELL